MADTTTVHIGENSPEQIAYKLMERVSAVENVNIHHHKPHNGEKVADRKWILKAYFECLRVVRGYSPE